MWLFVIWFLPAILSITVGNFAGFWGAGLGLAFVWLGFCISLGLIIVRQKEFVVIERLGKFKSVYFRGWHVRVIGVDRVRAKGDLLAKQLHLYADESAPDMDFADASAPLDASIWYQIGDPADITAAIRNGIWEKVAKSVEAWVYTYKDPESRIYNLADAELRPRFQKKKIDDASTARNGIADDVMDAIVPEMKKFGAYTPSDGKRLTIEDIDLPPGVIALRELALEGKKRAEESAYEAVGYWKAIKVVSKKLGITVQEARGIYETQRGLDTLREVKPDMTLVSKDLAGALINIGVNK